NAALPADTALSSGTQTLTVALKTAGLWNVTASDVTDGSKTANTSSLTVSAGAFAKLQLLVPGESAVPGSPSGKTGTPTAQTAGTAFTNIVNGVDANWNLVTRAADTVAITTCASNATCAARAVLVARG